MSEEIKIRVGIDNDPAFSSLQKLEQGAAKTAESIKEKFSEIGGGLLSKISVGSFFSAEGINKVLEFGEGIKRLSEETNVSTDTIQGLRFGLQQTGVSAEMADKTLEKLSVKIGQARDGSKEASDAFSKIGVSLTDASGNMKDTGEVLNDVADSMKNTADPTERARMAVDIFGKAGAKLIPVLKDGAEGLKKYTDSANKLSEADIETIAKLHQELEKGANGAMVWAGKIISAFGAVSQAAGAIWGNGMTGFVEWQNGSGTFAAKDKEKNQASGPKGMSKEAKAAWDEFQKAQREDEIAGLKGKEKILALQKQEDEIIEKMRGLDVNGIDYIKLKIEAEKQHTKIKKEQFEQADKAYQESQKAAKEKAAADKKADEDAKKLVVHNEHMVALDEKLAIKQRERGDQNLAPYQSSLQELANTGSWGFNRGTGQNSFQQGPYARQAREIMRLEAEAKNRLAYGNKAGAEYDIDRIKHLRAPLEAAGIITPDRRMESIDDGIKELVIKITNGDAKFQATGSE